MFSKLVCQHTIDFLYYFSYYPGKKDIKAVVVEELVDMWPGLVLKDWDFLKRCCEH